MIPPALPSSPASLPAGRLATAALLALALPACSAPAPPAAAPNARPHPQAAPLPRFTDITDQAGIRFRHQNSATPRKYFIEIMGSGGAFLDYDQDGRQDLLFINNTRLPGGRVQGEPTMQLYRNVDGRRFADVTAAVGLKRPGLFGMGAAAGDYDNDGDPDLYVTCALDSSRLYRNDRGRFTDVTEQAGVGCRSRWSTSAAWLDYDRDGRLDLFVCHYVKYRGLHDDQPCFVGSRRVYCLPVAYEPIAPTLFHNEGGGRFRDVSRQTGIAAAKGKGLGVSLWDYNDDGFLDLFVANDTVPGFLFRNEGGRRFSEVGVEAGIAYNEEGNPHSGMGIDAADVDNDGRTRLAITNYQGHQTSFYALESRDAFRDQREEAGIAEETGKVLGFGVLFFDFDCDGLKDMLQVNGHVQDEIEKREPTVRFAQPTLLFRNLGRGRFAEVGLAAGRPFSHRVVGRGAACADIDDDGDLDVMVTANNGRARLWRNDSAAGHAWIGLRLVGTRSPRDGNGALVLATTGTVTRRALCRTGSSYLSQSDLRVHFGLGTARSADLEIRWPSGTVDRIQGAPAGRWWTLTEGSSRLMARPAPPVLAEPAGGG